MNIYLLYIKFNLSDGNQVEKKDDGNQQMWLFDTVVLFYRSLFGSSPSQKPGVKLSCICGSSDPFIQPM